MFYDNSKQEKGKKNISSSLNLEYFWISIFVALSNSISFPFLISNKALASSSFGFLQHK